MPLEIDDLKRLAHSQFAVGALGSVVALKFAPGVSWAERAFNVLAGSMCAGFCAPALAEWLRIGTPGMLAFMAFAVGLFGLSLTAALLQGIRDLRVADIISGWVSRKG